MMAVPVKKTAPVRAELSRLIFFVDGHICIACRWLYYPAYQNSDHFFYSTILTVFSEMIELSDF